MDDPSNPFNDLTKPLTHMFVEAANFEEEDDNEDLFENNGTDAAKFVPAIQLSNHEKVICKIYNPQILKEGTNPGSENRTDQCFYKQLMLLREVIFLKELNHPTIVDFKGFNLYNGVIKYQEEEEEEDQAEQQINTNPTLFLEYLDNKSLQSFIEKNKKNGKTLPPVKCQIAMIALAAAVKFLHSKKILHRSLNPRTIWLDKDFYPKVFDFSTSRQEVSSADISKTSLESDSIYYQAPELFEGGLNDYKDSIDIYALGRLMYYFMTGYEPFKHKNDKLLNKGGFYLQDKIKNEQAYPYFPENANQQLIKLLKQCWDIIPNNRPTANEIYFYLTNDNKYLLESIKDEDMPEIEKYISMIDSFEIAHSVKKVRPDYDSVISYEYTQIEPEVPSSPAEQEQVLTNIISSGFISDQDFILSLIKQMAKNGSIYQGDYLPKVINYINDLDHSKSSEILTTIFGEEAIKSRGTTEIKMNTLNKDITCLNIPPWITKIGKTAFAGYDKLTKVNIPNSVKVIEEDAFSSCSELEFVNLPENLESLGKGAFKGCSKLRHVKIPSKIEAIPPQAFKGNKKLATVILNEGLKTIGKEAFYECAELTYVEIPKTVTLIEDKAFHHCPSLKTVIFKGSRKIKTGKKAINWKVNTYQ